LNNELWLSWTKNPKDKKRTKGRNCAKLIQSMVQIFCARPKIELDLVPLQKIFVPALKWNLLNKNHLLVWHKKFGMGAISKYLLV